MQQTFCLTFHSSIIRPNISNNLSLNISPSSPWTLIHSTIQSVIQPVFQFQYNQSHNITLNFSQSSNWSLIVLNLHDFIWTHLPLSNPVPLMPLTPLDLPWHLLTSLDTLDPSRPPLTPLTPLNPLDDSWRKLKKRNVHWVGSDRPTPWAAFAA